MSPVLESEKNIPTKPPAAQTIFWYRDLPPLDAEPAEAHRVEASSKRVAASLAYRDELWTACYADAIAKATRGLEGEIARLSGRCAHVRSESVEVCHARTGEAWLHITLSCMLYR